MPESITITGTRSTDHHPDQWYRTAFSAYLAPFAAPRAHFFIGGAKGIDSLALLCWQPAPVPPSPWWCR